MHLFYSTNIQNDKIALDNEESKHLAKVLRLVNGEKAVVIDGKGTRYECTISLAHHKSAELKIDKKVTIDEVFGVEIAVAPTKNLNRWEWFVEKATEIGIDAIHPFTSFNSERKVLKRERQNRILISAAKQSYKATIPALSELMKLNELFDLPFVGKKYIAHCFEHIPKMSLKRAHTKGEKALILIGPEGDFSEREVEIAIGKGFKSISLSESRLRTETAALIACHTIHLINA